MATRATQVKVNFCKMLYAGNGILAHALMEKTVNAGMHVGRVQKHVSWESHTRLHRMKTLVSRLSQASSAGSRTSASDLSAYSQGKKWEPEDFIKVHKLVRESGKHNFESCRILIPTAIRHGRIIGALGQEAIVKSKGCLVC